MTLLTIVLLACITFSTRYLFLEGRLPIRLGPNLKHLLSYSGPAVLIAIAAPIILVHDQHLDIALDNSYIWGAVVAILAAYKTRSIYWTIGLGMLVFVLLNYL
ncbi:AzlD domain-containing protein [Porticoccaceae bacterium]|jgi:branched-subunit amino acid transport protein|nr:AzlD domain-containing protein [Porticoccaceae bacterium]